VTISSTTELGISHGIKDCDHRKTRAITGFPQLVDIRVGMTSLISKQPSHEDWMRIALQMADQASRAGEVPVGAVLVGPAGEIARGCNEPIGSSDPTAHAEIQVLRRAARVLGNYRLPDTTLYVTVEPCTMCAGALVHARIHRLVFGTREPKGGAVVSRQGTFEGLNHSFDILEGVLELECSRQLTDFFVAKRLAK
jgi:tRNA(adenine34) deaminase